MLKCCRVSLSTKSCNVVCGENTCVKEASFGVSYSATGWEFNANDSTIYIK